MGGASAWLIALGDEWECEWHYSVAYTLEAGAAARGAREET